MKLADTKRVDVVSYRATDEPHSYCGYVEEFWDDIVTTGENAYEMDINWSSDSYKTIFERRKELHEA